MDEIYRGSEFRCECGLHLRANMQYVKGLEWTSNEGIRCPKCEAEHYLPTKPLQLFVEDHPGHWVEVTPFDTV